MRLSEESKHIWFTSDTHLLHPKIVEICDRPISIENHDDWIIDRFNSVVDKKDQLFILGDVSMGNLTKTDKLLDRLNGKKTLILGNHDNSIKHSTRFEEICQIKDFAFDSPMYKNIHLVLCHYPMLSWNRKVNGSGHLFGHVHGRLPGVGLSMDVGVDANNYMPINLEQIYDRLTKISLNLM